MNSRSWFGRALAPVAALLCLLPVAVLAQGPSLEATQTVAGTFGAGSTVTYTVTITNTQTVGQADLAGDEFTETLPAGLTLVDASASSGTVVASVQSNKVTWNRAIAASATYTITIHATIGASVAPYTLLSAQGAVSFDADGNGSNEMVKPTDDPALPGAQDPTDFKVHPVAPSITQTFTGTTTPGSTLTFTVTISNPNAVDLPDAIGSEFVEVLPASMTLLTASADAGTATANPPGDEDGGVVTWDGAVPANGTATITFTASINANASGQIFTLQGVGSYDADGDGTDETSVSSDDPGTAAARDANIFTTPYAIIAATQSLAGPLFAGTTVTYTIVLKNNGTGTQPDNNGDEFSEGFPLELTLVSASASSGTVVATPNTGGVTWNGSIPGGGSVTITVVTQIPADAVVGSSISAQGAITYDYDISGDNETTSLTSSPTSAESPEPNVFIVRDVASTFDRVFAAGTTTTSFNALANDMPNGATLTLVSVSTPAHGSVTFMPDGTIRYTPASALGAGGDTFTYTVADASGTMYTSTVTVADFATSATNFNGLVRSEAGTTTSNDATGVVHITSTKTGAFSGTLTLAGTKFPFRGMFDAFGIARFGTRAPFAATQAIKRPATKPRQPAPPVLALTFQIITADEIAGELNLGGSTFAMFEADRTNYTAARNPVAPLVNVPTALLGKYIVVFPPQTAPNRGLGVTQYPQGYGFGFVTVTKTGTAVLAGTLADGTKVSSSNAISYRNDWPIYASLYVKGGSVSGDTHFDLLTPGGPILAGSNLVWFRPPNARALKYKDGWTGGILLNLTGAPY